MPTRPRQTSLHIACALALAALIFVADLNVELGVAVGVAYLLVISLAYLSESAGVVQIAAIGCSILTLIGLYQSPAGGEDWKVLSNRVLALAAIWATAAPSLHLLRQKSELESRVAERTAQLARANASLEQSNAELKQFAYIASHDLQAPLRGVAGFAQFLATDYGDQLDETGKDFIQRIVSGVQRMKNLIDDLLEFSTVDSRQQPSHPVDLNEVFEDVMFSMRAFLTEIGAEVATAGELPSVSGDRGQILRLLQNLIDNAVNYRSSKPLKVVVSAQRKGEGWRISVSDNGIGIAPEHRERIFEIFRRLHNEKDYPGTGIGLAICRSIVGRHGGEIWVEAEPNQGTVFHFTLADVEGGTT